MPLLLPSPWPTLQRQQACHCHCLGVCLWRCLGWPTLDVFAGDARNQHVMSRYCTLFHSPRALGANAMYQNWQRDACRHGLPGMLWVFPPFPLIGAVINKLLSEQLDAVLILPKFMRYWVPMLQQLPVLDGHECSWFGGMYSNGSRAPNDMKDSNPQYVLTAFLVRF